MSVPKITTLKCNRCGQVKPLSEFVSDKRMKLGVLHYCKQCRCDERAENGSYLRERIRKYQYRAKDDAMITMSVNDLKKMLRQRTCTYCGCELTPANTTIDHIYPLSDTYGGSNTVVVSCRSCNASKGNRHVYDFYRNSNTFTDELWTKFVRDFTERLLHRHLTDIEVEQMKRNFADEAADLATGGEAHEKAI